MLPTFVRAWGADVLPIFARARGAEFFPTLFRAWGVEVVPSSLRELGAGVLSTFPGRGVRGVPYLYPGVECRDVTYLSPAVGSGAEPRRPVLPRQTAAGRRTPDGQPLSEPTRPQTVYRRLPGTHGLRSGIQGETH